MGQGDIATLTDSYLVKLLEKNTSKHAADIFLKFEHANTGSTGSKMFLKLTKTFGMITCARRLKLYRELVEYDVTGKKYIGFAF